MILKQHLGGYRRKKGNTRVRTEVSRVKVSRANHCTISPKTPGWAVDLVGRRTQRPKQGSCDTHRTHSHSSQQKLITSTTSIFSQHMSSPAEDRTASTAVLSETATIEEIVSLWRIHKRKRNQKITGSLGGVRIEDKVSLDWWSGLTEEQAGVWLEELREREGRHR